MQNYTEEEAAILCGFIGRYVDRDSTYDTKWTPQLRDRYFDILADCTDLSCVDYQETPNAQLMAYRRIVKQSDMLLAVYDLELASDSAEDKAMGYALALGKPTLLIHPNTWKKKWLNVVKREGE